MPLLRKTTTKDADTPYSSDEKAQRFAKISRLSAFMKWVLTIFMVFIFLVGLTYIAALIGWDIADILEENIEYVEPERTYGALSFTQKAAIAIYADAMLGSFLIMLWYMRNLFKAFQRQVFFATKTLSDMVKTGIWFVVFGLFDLIEAPVFSFIGTYDLPEGEKQITFGLDGGELSTIFFGLLFILLGWVMREAAVIDEENKQFI